MAVQPEGMRGIEEQVQRRLCEDHVRVAHVDRDVARTQALVLYRRSDILGTFVGVCEDQLAPAAFKRDVLAIGLGLAVETVAVMGEAGGAVDGVRVRRGQRQRDSFRSSAHP
jgi:hypothetical protein